LKLYRQIFWYAVASGCALVVDMVLLWVLVKQFAVNYLIAAGVSFTSGATIAYAISVRLAFHQHRLANRAAEFLIFVALGTIGLAITTIVMSFAVGFLGLHYLIGKCMAAGCTFTCNFVLRRYVLFTQPGQS
jgi:putative flippase GtrA